MPSTLTNILSRWNHAPYPYKYIESLKPCPPPLLSILINKCWGMMLKFLKPTAKKQFQRRTPTFIYYWREQLRRWTLWVSWNLTGLWAARNYLLVTLYSGKQKHPPGVDRGLYRCQCGAGDHSLARGRIMKPGPTVVDSAGPGLWVRVCIEWAGAVGQHLEGCAIWYHIWYHVIMILTMISYALSCLWYHRTMIS
jgi:hypothetical protein